MGAYFGKNKKNKVSHSVMEAEIRARLAAAKRSQIGKYKLNRDANIIDKDINNTPSTVVYHMEGQTPIEPDNKVHGESELYAMFLCSDYKKANLRTYDE